MAIDILSIDEKINQDEIDKDFKEHIEEAEADMLDSLMGDLFDLESFEDSDEYEEDEEYSYDDYDSEKKPKKKKEEDSIVTRMMTNYLTQIKKLGEYSQEQINEKVRLYKKYTEEGNKKAAVKVRNDVVEHNLRLVITVAKKYRKSYTNAEFIDVIQTGNIGLIHAVERFEPDMGYKFSTYAWWWIRQYISRAIQDNRTNIKLSTALAIDVGKANFTLAKEEDKNREESVKLLRKEYGWTKKHAEEVYYYTKMQKIGSLNSLASESYGGDNETEVQDMIPDKDDQFEKVENRILSGQIREILKQLPHENAADIMMRYYGVGDYDAPQTLEEIEEEYLIPKNKIQALIRKSVAYLNRKPELHDALAQLARDDI